jgi:hypothetical protein
MHASPDLHSETAVLGRTSSTACADASSTEGTVRPRQPPVGRSNSTPYLGEQYPLDHLRDRDWLREKYLHHRLGSHAIGRMVGRSPGTVIYHLRKHEIPIRDRREAARRTDSQVVYP